MHKDKLVQLSYLGHTVVYMDVVHHPYCHTPGRSYPQAEWWLKIG